MQKRIFLITFRLRTVPGKKVTITADFLKWSSVPMEDQRGDGTYVYKVQLPPGDYLYRYQVNGRDFNDPFCKETDIDERTSKKCNVRHVHAGTSEPAGGKRSDSGTLSATLKACRESAIIGEKQAYSALDSIENSLKFVLTELRNSVSPEVRLKSVDETTRSIRQEFDKIEARFGLLPMRIGEELDTLKRRKADFSIVLFGRTMAGKSTLMEILTNGQGTSIGTGGQRTTRDVRSYYWNGLEVVDVPGVCAADGGDDEGVALDAVKHADLVLFLITDDAPMPDEARFLNLVRTQGKPVVGILNVKLAIDETGERDINKVNRKDIEYFLRELQSTMTEDHCKNIENQFNEFLQKDAAGPNVYFVPVHLLAGFAAKKLQDVPLAVRLRRESNLALLEEVILKTIRAHGREYRLKCFLDTVIRPLQDFAGELFHQSLLSSRSGRLVLQKRRDLENWRGEYETTCKTKIDFFVTSSQLAIQKKIPGFAEQNYESSSAGDAWNGFIKSCGLEKKAQALGQEMLDDLRKKIESLSAELKFEENFSSPPINVKMDSITDWKRIWNWGGTLTGAGFAIAALVVGSGPLGWVAAGIGLLTWLGSFLFEDREEKRKRARNELEDKLREHTRKMFQNYHDSLTRFLNEKLLKKQFAAAQASMSKVCNALFVLSEQQRKLAAAISSEIVRMNGILVSAILNGENLELEPQSIGRIPGEITMMVLPSKTEDLPAVCRLLGTSLKETIRFIVQTDDNPQKKIRKILDLSFDEAKTCLSYERKIDTAHFVPPQGDLTPEQRTRILLAQQLTGITISIEEEQP